MIESGECPIYHAGREQYLQLDGIKWAIQLSDILLTRCIPSNRTQFWELSRSAIYR